MSKYNYPYKLLTFKENVTNIDFLVPPGPNVPYVLLSAFTGEAALNIDGQTLHTLFSFPFVLGFQSLSDKNRDIERALYKTLNVLITDEISLVDADRL